MFVCFEIAFPGSGTVFINGVFAISDTQKDEHQVFTTMQKNYLESKSQEHLIFISLVLQN